MIFQFYLVVTAALVNASLKDPRHCEVCIGTLQKFETWAAEQNFNIRDAGKFEGLFRNFCKTVKSKEEAFCYYVGALDTSATSVINVLAKPVSYYKPIEKICKEDIYKLDPQTCELRYEKEIDWNTVDLKKMRVGELKKILTKWNEVCHACTEKSEFIQKIESVKHKYITISPKSAKTDLDY
ncbi:hypothetical protein GJ496_003624 [Pomphorhynchus laevis]|nr:hypothetical protein GJ496_003624 [Pomphorhynchus laevis]